MIEAADAKPEPEIGWYVIMNDKGECMTCWWNQDLSPLLKNSYPIVSVADLLRDAARYRWLRDGHRLSEVFIGTGGDAVNLDNETPEQVDAIIDAKMAAERKPEGRE